MGVDRVAGTEDAVVVGAGVSGLVTARWMRDAGYRVTVVERTGEMGGVWTFRENGYGVMRFTHINVSKYNYCFSDFPFPEDVPDHPHHKDMANYIVNYAKHFDLYQLIRFEVEVKNIHRKGDNWVVTTVALDPDQKEVPDTEEDFEAKYVAIATGHHATPRWVQFPGQETFPGDIIHSVSFKDAITNRMVGKKVLVVGIGNSGVDVAINCASVGRCKSVYVCSRSGAWIIPNFLFGWPTDLYTCRAFLWLPWKLSSAIFETLIKLASGNPNNSKANGYILLNRVSGLFLQCKSQLTKFKKGDRLVGKTPFRWKLNPKMRVLQTQLTVSPFLIPHVQRKEIKIVPNIQKICGSTVHFEDGQSADFDHIVLSTGYQIDLPFLGDSLREKLLDKNSNAIKLYKNVFSPEVGHSLAFIGYVQPTSGGILPMAEVQAMWFVSLTTGQTRLPTKEHMEEDIQREERKCQQRYFKSARHIIQKDAIIYNDEVTSLFEASPQFWRHPSLAWRLLLGSCGPAQWRLQGPFKWNQAADVVRSVPLTNLFHYSGILLIAAIAFLLALFCFVWLAAFMF